MAQVCLHAVGAACRSLSAVLFFTVEHELRHRLPGGTIIEVQAKSGDADAGDVRARLSELNLGDVQVQEFGDPRHRADPRRRPGGRRQCRAERRSRRCAASLADDYDFRRVEVVGPTVSSELAWTARSALLSAMLGDAGLHLVPLRMAVRHRRDHRHAARRDHDGRLLCRDRDRVQPDQYRGDPDDHRLLAQRHRRRLRPHPRKSAQVQEDADRRAARTSRSTRRCRAPS